MPGTTPTRRTVLAATATGLSAGVLGTTASGRDGSGSEYVLVQGETCVPVRPIRGRDPVTAFYDYRLPRKYATDENGAFAGGSALYASAGTTDLQRAQTSVAFLYRGPERLSLVVVHGRVGSEDGGAVTLQFAGLPADGEWLVMDDRYRDPVTGEPAATNYDAWRVAGSDQRVDWTWGSGGTDGGAYGGLGDEFEVIVDPAFNGAAALFGEYYEGTVTSWEFVSGADGRNRISLRMDEPVRIATGSCEPATSATDGQQTDREGGESDAEREDDEDEEERDEEERDEEEQDEGTEQKHEEEQDEETEKEHEEEQDEDEGTEREHEAAEGEEDRETHTVCHRPPGNPENAHTIRVGSDEALDAHLGHGDSLGPCDG